MVAPDDETDHADPGHRDDHRLVAEDRATCAGGQHFGHDAEGWDDDDVDFGVSEEPEQVLEEDRVSTKGVEGRSNGVIKEQEGHTDDEGRKRHEEHEHGDEHGPREERNAPPGHTGSTHGEHGGDEVHTAEGARGTEHDHA